MQCRFKVAGKIGTKVDEDSRVKEGDLMPNSRAAAWPLSIRTARSEAVSLRSWQARGGEIVKPGPLASLEAFREGP